MSLLERREFLKNFLAATALLTLYPKVLLDVIDQESPPFPWKREEILFGPQAGFKQARAQIPLAVYVNPSIPPEIVEVGITAWNTLAREIGRNDLFYIEDSPSKAKIAVVPGSGFHVTAYPDYTSPYEKCHIELNIDLLNIFTQEVPRVVTHELGHTLGLVDFVFGGSSLEGLVNPQRCDLPDKPIRSIMAANSRWFGDDDPKMLQLAGYV